MPHTAKHSFPRQPVVCAVVPTQTPRLETVHSVGAEDAGVVSAPGSLQGQASRAARERVGRGHLKRPGGTGGGVSPSGLPGGGSWGDSPAPRRGRGLAHAPASRGRAGLRSEEGVGAGMRGRLERPRGARRGQQGLGQARGRRREGAGLREDADRGGEGHAGWHAAERERQGGAVGHGAQGRPDRPAGRQA